MAGSTILPVALATGAIRRAAALGMLFSFTVVTLETFVVLTVVGRLGVYQLKGECLEERGNLIPALVPIAIGMVVSWNLT